MGLIHGSFMFAVTDGGAFCAFPGRGPARASFGGLDLREGSFPCDVEVNADVCKTCRPSANRLD